MKGPSFFKGLLIGILLAIPFWAVLIYLLFFRKG
jgi:hypothetical protein